MGDDVLFAHKGIIDVSNGCEMSSALYLRSAETGRPLKIIHGCGRRYDCQCPVCAEKWRRRNRANFREVIKEWNAEDIRMLTLTLRKNWKEQPMVDRIVDLWKFRKELFRYLREVLHFWIGGWTACIELPNHMHILMESDYIPHDLIKAKWAEITGDSFYVYINQWKNIRDMHRFALHYLTKYLTKLGNIAYENAIQLKGFHLVCINRGKGRRKPIAVREKWIRIDELEFCAIYLDYYPNEAESFLKPAVNYWEKWLIPS